MKELKLEILPNGNKHISFMFCYKFYLIIQRIKAKFLVSENEFMCRYYKIIWIPSPKCNAHI
jgi:hypothetical protein